MPVHLDVGRRARVTAALLAALREAAPGSTASLRGSLAAGTADDYSDIDVCWLVGAAAFGDLCERIGSILEAVRPVASLRLDADTAASPTYRLFSARFAELPLFWRVDLEILSEAHDASASPPDANESDWSHTHSALMCAVAAIKACLRGQPEEGALLVSKGFERIQIPVPAGPPHEQIRALVDTIYDADDSYAELAAEIRRLHEDALEG